MAISSAPGLAPFVPMPDDASHSAEALRLRLGNGECPCIAASGALPAEVLRELSGLLRLPLVASADGEPSVTLADGMPAASYLPMRAGSHLFRDTETGRFHFYLGCTALSGEARRLVLLRLMHLALLCAVRRGCALVLHGALLFHPERRRGIVLFGRSGVGKSTASERFTRQGGEVLSDDRLVLSFGADGAIWAQPIPTWSRYAEHPAVDFGRAVPLGALAMLYRGCGDEVIEAAPSNWKVALMQSMANVLGFPRNWLSAELRQEFMAAALPHLEELRRRFGMLEVEGDLKGNLYDTLSGIIC